MNSNKWFYSTIAMTLVVSYLAGLRRLTLLNGWECKIFSPLSYNVFARESNDRSQSRIY